MSFGVIELLLTVAFIVTCVYGFKLFSGDDSSSSTAVAKPAEAKERKESEADAGLIPVNIFYGSQSGTAEGFADEMQGEAKAQGFKATVVDLEDYEPEDLKDEKFAVFLMATFGEGEPTDNAVGFWEYINNSARDDEEPMNSVNFAVFGLGNRQYEHFCTMGIKLDELMGKYGAKRVCEKGIGDDDGTLDEDFEAWKKDFWPAARKHFGLAPISDAGTSEFEPSYEFKVVAEDMNAEGLPARFSNYSTHKALSRTKDRPVFAPVTVSRELRQDTAAGSTLHIDLNIAKLPALRFITADNLGICPKNDDADTGRIMTRLGAQPNALFTMKGKKDLFPSPCSFQDAFQWMLDFNNVPRISLIQRLARYATDDKEKDALNHIVNDEDAKHAFLADQKSLLEVLEEFPSVTVPINHFLEFCPKLQPRYYTIASSSKKDKDTVGITLSVLTEDKPRGRVFKGVATHHAASLTPTTDSLPVFVRSSAFRLPKDLATTPVIMCGPGTGIAPFRGFIQEFAHLKETKNLDVDAHLYFGCRRSDTDYIYKDELEAALDSGVLKGLHLAFSREQEHKVYVQDLMEKNAAEIWEALHEKNAYFYVCGATTMGTSIREFVVRAAQTQGNMSEEKAREFLADLQKQKRFVQELWG